MKKAIVILLAAMVMLSSVSLAEDLSSLSDADLLVLYRQVSIELESRGIDPKAVYPEDAFSGDDLWTEEMAERLELFFGFWNASDIPNMLTVCSSGWKAGRENPDTDLLAILRMRTLTDYEILSVSAAAEEDSRIVSLIAGIDRNNGKDPRKYFLQITMTREGDGTWYVNPDSLESPEHTAGGAYADPLPGSAEETPETTGNTVLYFCPEGGEYYHRDRNCRTVQESYLPLEGAFLYAELGEEAYQGLKPCTVCGAPARRENQSRSVSFRDAVDAAGEFVTVGFDLDYLAAAIEKDGKYLRMVTLPDDHARELYMAILGGGDSGEAFEAFQAYAWSLPVAYTEEITMTPKGQAELDALAGKTVGELLEEGYSFFGIAGGEDLPTVVELTDGMFNYEFEVDASFEKYRGDEGWDGVEEMKVKSGKLSCFSNSAANPDYLADGTYEPQVVPHISAEEAAAADPVPPAEEYTMKAWPLDAEGYADLLDNMEARYGQVYAAKGVVHQVLSQSPLTIILNTGEDGTSQPVIIEYPEQSGFTPEAGGCYRIYADVSSSCYILPVLKARYTYRDPAEALPDGQD